MGLSKIYYVNCRDVFMSGNLFSNATERTELGKKLNKLETLVLDDNKYLSDVLLMRITEITSKLRKLR